MINESITRRRARTALFCVALFFLLLPMDMTDGVMGMSSVNAEDIVVAVVNNESIYASNLEKLITQYKTQLGNKS